MTKYELIKEIKEIANSHEAKVTAQQTELVYDAVLECIRKHTIADEKLSLSDLGVFTVNLRPARNGVNPKTGEKIVISERKVVKFRPGKLFLETLEGSSEQK